MVRCLHHEAGEWLKAKTAFELELHINDQNWVELDIWVCRRARRRLLRYQRSQATSQRGRYKVEWRHLQRNLQSLWVHSQVLRPAQETNRWAKCQESAFQLRWGAEQHRESDHRDHSPAWKVHKRFKDHTECSYITCTHYRSAGLQQIGRNWRCHWLHDRYAERHKKCETPSSRVQILRQPEFLQKLQGLAHQKGNRNFPTESHWGSSWGRHD